MERRRRKWKALQQWLNIRIEDEAGVSVCTVYGLNDAGRRNAHEIAALPDIISAAKGVIDARRKFQFDPVNGLLRSRFAASINALEVEIAKAEGRL